MWRTALVFHFRWSPSRAEMSALIFGPGSHFETTRFPDILQAYKYFDSNGWEPISGSIDDMADNRVLVFRKSERAEGAKPGKKIKGKTKKPGKELMARLKELGLA